MRYNVPFSLRLGHSQFRDIFRHLDSDPETTRRRYWDRSWTTEAGKTEILRSGRAEMQRPKGRQRETRFLGGGKQNNNNEKEESWSDQNSPASLKNNQSIA